MAYQVLARKWRPQDFSSVVGQPGVVTALRNAVADGRIAQAYLFSGIRGVGKTSVARVLAKALNCEQGPGEDPCNECVACREITQGSDLDVLEVDAATYSKVEQVRELTESLRYGPARDRYKVVVIDEIHRLSRQAFDALLKIVEEPPDHLVFVFATTEIEAVPATILSRCQEFSFRRVPSGVLTEHLERIAEAEEIEASERALRLIARASEGSVRDGVALLDQLATYGGGKVPEQEAARILGGVDAALHHRALGAILAGDGAAVSALVGEIDASGWDPRAVLSEFLAYCRDALHAALGADPESLDLPAEDAEALAKTARRAGYENLLRLLHQLLASEMVVRRSESASLALEIALLRAAELPKLTRVEELLGGAPSGGGERRERAEEAQPLLADLGPPAGGTSSRPAATTAARPAAAPAAGPSGDGPGSTARAASGGPAAAGPRTSDDARAGSPAATPTATPQPGGGARAGGEVQPAGDGPAGGPDLEAFIEQVSQKKQSLAAHLSGHLRFEDGLLRIAADPWLTNALQRGNNREVLEACLAAVWGAGAGWRLVPAGNGPSRGSSVETAAPAAGDPGTEDPVLSHPVVQAALDIFGGTARAVGSEPAD